MRVGGQRHASTALPPERPGIHCIGCSVGPRAGLDGWGKISSPPGFDPRTVQPVASRYTELPRPMSRGITPLILNLDATRRREVSFALRVYLHWKAPRYLFSIRLSGPQNRCGRFMEDKTLFPPATIRPARSQYLHWLWHTGSHLETSN